MIRPYMHIVHFLCETALLLYFSWHIKSGEARNWKMAFASLPFLLLPGLLYSEDSVIGDNAWLRMAFRGGCYLCFFRLDQKGSVKQCAYYALLSLVLFTAKTNLFQTPLLYPVSRGQIPFVSNPVGNFVLCLFIEYLVCFGLFFAFVKLVNLTEIVDVQYHRFAVALAVLFCEIYVKASLHTMGQSDQAIMRQMSLYTIFLQIVIVGLLIVFENFLYTRRIQEITRLQELSSHYQVEAYRRQAAYETNTHRLYHDMKNHLLAIRSLCEGDVPRIEEYVDTLVGEFIEAEPVMETGSPLLDGLLAQKAGVARSQQIEFSAILDAKTIAYISDTDLCTIFANALDNAIEACQKLPPERERFIELKGGAAGEQCFITVTNSFNGKILSQGEQLLTAKKDKTLHGYGVRNIRATVEKYGGALAIDTEGNIFKLTIMLPMGNGT